MVDLQLSSSLLDVYLQEADEGGIQVVVGDHAGHFNPLHQVEVVGIDWSEPIHEVVLVLVRSGVPQSAERVEATDRSHRPFGLHILRLIKDHDWSSCLDELDWPPARHTVLGPIDDVGLCWVVHFLDVLLKRLDIHYEDLNRVGGGELTHSTELL